MRLSAKQEAAATRSGQDVCVVAGPGSGKTRVLIQRFAWLVRERGIAPGRILAITFTDKAATEIKKRLVGEFAGEEETRARIERAYVSTVHGFCARLLKENAIAAGVDPGFGVMEGPEAEAEQADAARVVLDGLFAEDAAGMRRLLNAVHVPTFGGGFAPDLAGALLSVYEALRIAGREPGEIGPLGGGGASLRPALELVEELLRQGVVPTKTEAQQRRAELIRAWVDRARVLVERPLEAAHFAVAADEICDLRAAEPVKSVIREAREALTAFRVRAIGAYYPRERELVVEALRRIHGLYRERKRARSVLDFGDLEEAAIGLLEGNAEVRERVRAGFDQILMDELQDTNPLQWRLVDLIRREGNFFAVGDINQSIYGFRHADPGVFARYQEKLLAEGKAVDRLDDNYRSRGEILAAVEQVLAGAPGIVENPLRAEGTFPEAAGPVVELICGQGETSEEASRVEASQVARRIREMAAAGEARFADMAVLGRTTAALESMRGALEEFGIPHLVVGGRTFFEKPEVRDLVHWLQVLENPSHEIALAGVLRSPLVGLADETLLRIREEERGLIDSVERAAGEDPYGCPEEERERLRWFWGLFGRQRRVRDYVGPDRLLAEVMDESGYEAGLTGAARRNAEKLLELVRGRFRAAPAGLRVLLEDLGSAREAGAEPDAPPDNAADAVTLLSMHRSKGLEFPVVFVVALHKATAGQQPPISYSPEAGLGVSWRDPSDPGKGIGDSARAAFVTATRDRESGEENRLLYVAMTRAERHLVLSYAASERGRLAASGRLVAEKLAEAEERFGEAAVNMFPPVVEAETGGVATVERVTAGAQYDSIITVTALAAFRQDPQKYYLSRYLGMEGMLDGEGSGGGGSAAVAVGTQVHELLAEELVEEPEPLAVELVERFRESELGRRVERASRVEREFEVLLAVEDVVVRGTIDLWFEEGGELVLVDYKTDWAVKPGHYEVQLRLYALALREMTGRLPGRAVLAYLRAGEEVEVSLGEAELEDARRAVVELREAQERMAFG